MTRNSSKKDEPAKEGIEIMKLYPCKNSKHRWKDIINQKEEEFYDGLECSDANEKTIKGSFYANEFNYIKFGIRACLGGEA